MIRLSCALALVILLCCTIFSEPVAARRSDPSLRSLDNKLRLEAKKRWESSPRRRSGAGNTRRAADTSASPGVKNITFTNPLASKFYVDGTKIPLVDFDVGPSWAGLIPISAAANETGKLFFWLFPPGPEGSPDDLIIWLNGGPGCSSLEGSLQENGPFLWQRGQAVPTPNQWSWTNLSTILYIEQPIGTGYSQGNPTAKDENDIAQQLVGFLQQFLEIFKELKGKNLYLTGESYGGMYIPYLANFIYENTTRATLDLDLIACWMNDPQIGWPVVQSQIGAVGFVHDFKRFFAFNQTFLAQLDSVAAKCNYANYTEKYLMYPPRGPLPLPGTSTRNDPDCDVWEQIEYIALYVNPAFNVYHIGDTMPILSDVLSETQTPPLYFNRQDVKEAIHAPLDVDWTLCNASVFLSDASPPSAFTVLPNVIEKSKRVVIAQGLLDFLFTAEGTRIVLQNMTWGGVQGFQQPITEDSFIVDGIGALGRLQSERGLTYVEIELSGHMVPAYSPIASFQLMEYLMGFRDSP
ncbi:alpha/beta-hydrolase [Russula ochroleuca]|uniref:Carboxypeptidase n=1 Tax=Russula ochroleuca TaxID=152965 RepID=A0A9P5N3A0_9AGAM|nr:alpha/beta-hydrolase [Russula ochroleuca]